MDDSQDIQSVDELGGLSADEKRLPHARWQLVEVNFTTADTDKVIPHTLRPKDVNFVKWEVMDRNAPGSIYRGSKAPSTDYIVLRSSIAGSFHLRLYIPAHYEPTASKLPTTSYTGPAPSVPVGAGFLWYASAAPTGYLLADGTSVLRSDYPALFAVIGTTYGSADGTHFTLPDLRQRFPLGKAASGTGNTLAGTGGGIDHTHTSAAHTHTFSIASSGGGTSGASGILDITNGAGGGTYLGSFSGDWSHVIGGTSYYATPAYNAGARSSWDNFYGASSHTHSTPNHTHSGTTDSTTPGVTGTNNPPYVVVNYIIKT